MVDEAAKGIVREFAQSDSHLWLAVDRLMCLFFLAWSVLGFISACMGLARSEAVWHESGMFASHGLSSFRLINFAVLIGNQAVGVYSHAKRDAKKADIYFWGWVVYTSLCLLLELSRLGHIESDAKAFESSSCQQCIQAAKVNATRYTTCEDTDPADTIQHNLALCVFNHSTYYKSFAFIYGFGSMVIGFLLNAYFCLVARSYWFYLHDDRLAALGRSVAGDHEIQPLNLTPLEQQALGGDDENVYVNMESLLGQSRGW